VDQLPESGASILRRRRRRRAAITLSLVALLMLGTFAYAAAYFQGWVGSRSSASPTSQPCQSATPSKAPAPRVVTVNVYNATDRNGLAASVGKSLRTKGFKVAAVANDPFGRPVPGVAEIHYGRSGKAGATLVAKWFSGAKLSLDSRADASVDVVLGSRFTALSVPPKAVPAKVLPAKSTKSAPAKPTPSPSPSSAC